MSIKQLLKNYSYMLLKKIDATPKEEKGNIEWFEGELKRIEQALKPDSKETKHDS